MRDETLTLRAKAMRREQTPAEQRIWLALRAKRFSGVKFRRQKVIGRYIVDFAARDPMLVLEIDGDTHAARVGYDQARTDYLRDQGYQVVRFANADVMGNLDGVLETIAALVAAPPPPTSSPLPSLSPEGERV